MTSAIWLALFVAQSTPQLRKHVPDEAFDRMRGIAAACFCQLDFDRASQLSSRLLEWYDGTSDDYLAAALIESASRSPRSERVQLLLKNAREHGALELQIAYAEAETARPLLHANAGESVRALRSDWSASLRRVLELEPTNVWARWNLLLEDARDFDEADDGNSAEARAADAESVKLLVELLKEDPERLGPFALPVLERASRVFDGGPRARPDVPRYREWRDSDLDVTLEPFTQGGPLGVDLPRPRMFAPAGVADAPFATWTTAPQLHFATEGAVRSLDVADFERDFDDDVLVADARGLLLLRQRRDGAFAPERLADVDATCARIADLERLEFGDRSVVVGGPNGLAVFDPGADGRWSEEAAETTRGACSDLLVLDFDGDGDEDVVAILGGALYAWRNQGFATTEDRASVWKTGPLRMAEARIPFPKSDAPLAWIACEDFDRDRDVDLICGGAGAATRLLRCRKLGRFETVPPAASGLRSHAEHRPRLADLDRDGVADVLWIDAPVAWQRGRGDGTFDAPAPLPWLAPFASERATLVDADLDGELDLVAPAPDSRGGALVARLGSLLAETSATLAVGGGAPAGSPAILADLDQDADLDAVAVAADGAGVELRAAQPDHARHALHLRLGSGGRSARTSGAIVEARVDGRASRQFVRGEGVVVASGVRLLPDLIEIDWTHARNGALPRQFLYCDYSSIGIEPCRQFRLDEPEEDSTVLIHRPNGTIQFVSGFDFLRDPDLDRTYGMYETKVEGTKVQSRDPQPWDRGALAPRTLGGDWKLAPSEPGAVRVVRQQLLPGSVPSGPRGPFRRPPK
ncbi:MAG TPA: VCBS repeat-containing protein [Planctomycetota bacterium]|nr:VCBS repeat-containing protein [Planctomycetota bacterium]